LKDNAAQLLETREGANGRRKKERTKKWEEKEKGSLKRKTKKQEKKRPEQN